MLFSDNKKFLDEVAEVIRRVLGKGSSGILENGEIKTFSAYNNVGWEAKTESVRCNTPYTMLNLFENADPVNCARFAILWEALVEMAAVEDADPSGNGDNGFGTVVCPEIKDLNRGGRVSVNELVLRMAKHHKKSGKDKLLEEIPLAEDVAYVWIRGMGYVPDADKMEDKYETAKRISSDGSGEDAFNRVMGIWRDAIDYYVRVPNAKKWLDANVPVSAPVYGGAAPASGLGVDLSGFGVTQAAPPPSVPTELKVTWEEYQSNVVTIPDEFVSDLFGCRGIRGLYHLCKEKSIMINAVEYDARVKVAESCSRKLIDKMHDAVAKAKKAIGDIRDESTLDGARACIAELANACAEAEKLRADIPEDRNRVGQILQNLKAAIDAARKEIGECNRLAGVADADLKAMRDKERRYAGGMALLKEMDDISKYLSDFEKGGLIEPKCKAVIRKAHRELKSQISTLAELNRRIQACGMDFYKEKGVYGTFDALRQLAEGLQTTVLEWLRDPTIPEDLDSSLIDEKKWIYDLGDGVCAQFVLNDDSESGDSGSEEEEAESLGVVLEDFAKFHRLTDSAIDVRRQPVFGDYPDKDTYPYFRPFRFQLESVRTMLAGFGGRGIFGDQHGLGKTLQTLMTADVMFRCGAISNAVIIVREANVNQWRQEIAVKFRRADGEPMFATYPEQSEGGRPFYAVDDIAKVTKDSGFSKRGKALKIYFLSSESLQSSAFASKMERISNMGDEYALLSEHVDAIPKGTLEDYGKAIESATNTDTLYLIKKAVFGLLQETVERDERIDNLRYTGTVYGFEDFDYRRDSEVMEKAEFIGKDYFADLEKYNVILRAASERLDVMLKREREIADARENFKIGSIGLLIFDEVQDIIDKINSEYSDKRAAIALRDFIADLDKKYCILLSATPIKNDISDLFQLVYMIDKKRLGATRQDAEDNFYRTYCGGCRTLAEIAAAPDREERFSMLNDLVNSLFTRKRIYDADVIESMKRKCAEPDENDDYGGEKFEALMRVLSLAFEYENLASRNNTASLEKRIELKNTIASYRVQICGGFGMAADDFFNAACDMSRSITNVTVEDSYVNADLTSFDICREFLSHKQSLKQAEAEGDEVRIARYKGYCDRAIMSINKGLVQFYCRTDLRYSPVFIADYLDWTRQRKRGIRIYGIDSAARKVDVFVRAMSGKDAQLADVGMSADDVRELRVGKIVFYDRVAKNRADMYRALRAAESGNERRRIYLNLTDADVEREGFGVDDIVYLNYFGNTGSVKEMSERALAQIKNKLTFNMTAEESRYLDTYGVNSPVCSHSDINFRNFNEFSAENGNWNAVCFIDRESTVGTDLDAANVLCIGQLDDGNGDYLDPLELERLVGRVSHLGQTEDCLIYTCLYNGNEDGTQLDREFNEAYYDVLTDPAGLDLFGNGMTELSFAIPVVMACIKQMLIAGGNAPEGAVYDFTATTSADIDPVDPSENNFADLFRYVFVNRDKISITVRENGTEQTLDAIEGVKRLIRKYVSLVSSAPNGNK